VGLWAEDNFLVTGVDAPHADVPLDAGRVPDAAEPGAAAARREAAAPNVVVKRDAAVAQRVVVAQRVAERQNAPGRSLYLNAKRCRCEYPLCLLPHQNHETQYAAARVLGASSPLTVWQRPNCWAGHHCFWQRSSDPTGQWSHAVAGRSFGPRAARVLRRALRERDRDECRLDRR